MEVSSKSGFNIDRIFKISSDQILKNIKENIIDINDKVSYYIILYYVI